MKRWSFGLDSGCVYGRKLSALVIGKTTTRAKWDQADVTTTNDEEFDPEDKEVTDEEHIDIFMKKHASLPFGDRGVASIVDVSCR